MMLADLLRPHYIYPPIQSQANFVKKMQIFYIGELQVQMRHFLKKVHIQDFAG